MATTPSARPDDPPDDPPAGLRLRPPGHRVDRRAVRYWTVRALTAWTAVLAAQLLWLLLAPDGLPRLHQLGLLLTVLLAPAHLLVMPRRRYAVHRWEATEAAVYTQTGWLVEERRIAPLSRVQTVDHARGPIERLFGLTNVTVTTASSAGPLRISGLDEDTANRLTAELTRAARSSRAEDAA